MLKKILALCSACTNFLYICRNFINQNMRRYFFFLFVLMAFTMSSQRNNGSAVNSPEIARDGSVTFKVKAAGADTVRLIIDSRLDTLMKQAAGETWSITLRGLEPDLYMYHFIVDGMKVLDPENAQVLRDVKNVMNSFVLDPQGDCPVAVHDVPHGEVRAVWYDSPTLWKTAVHTLRGSRISINAS